MQSTQKLPEWPITPDIHGKHRIQGYDRPIRDLAPGIEGEDKLSPMSELLVDDIFAECQSGSIPATQAFDTYNGRVADIDFMVRQPRFGNDHERTLLRASFKNGHEELQVWFNADKPDGEQWEAVVIDLEAGKEVDRVPGRMKRAIGAVASQWPGLTKRYDVVQTLRDERRKSERLREMHEAGATRPATRDDLDALRQQLRVDSARQAA